MSNGKSQQVAHSYRAKISTVAWEHALWESCVLGSCERAASGELSELALEEALVQKSWILDIVHQIKNSMSKLRAAHWRGPYSVQLTTHQLIFSSVEPNQLYRPLTQCKRLPICDYHTSWWWDMHGEATRGPKDLTCCSGCTTWTEGSGHASRRHMLLACYIYCRLSFPDEIELHPPKPWSPSQLAACDLELNK